MNVSPTACITPTTSARISFRGKFWIAVVALYIGGIAGALLGLHWWLS